MTTPSSQPNDIRIHGDNTPKTPTNPQIPNQHANQQANTPDADVHQRVQRVIEAIRPAVQADGGDLELVQVDHKGIVTIRLHGACVGCPSSLMTLKVGIERNLRDNVPEVTEVQAID